MQASPEKARAALAGGEPPRRANFSITRPRAARDPVEEPDFISLVDQPPQLVRSGRKHGIGLLFLALIPVTAFALGTWQVKRLQWKTDLLARLEDRLIRDPLPLPPRIDPSAVPDFDYRRVYAKGHFRHDQEMLIGPRMREGEQGYEGLDSKEVRQPEDQERCSPLGEVTVEGLLREPWKKNMFTPDNRPDKKEFYFPDVKQMAELVGSQPIWVEATLIPEYLKMADYESRGVPIGRPPVVGLRNNHAQYIFTWYSLCIATSIMLYMVAKKPSSDITRRVRMSKNW
ncbi:unnamed protein product [Parascedosporium putredinis]|uniref:SURF1-like protein n=1 Tax=Parascedosporium putredinis TaxID=1442378 RepID=A0A9P1GVW2_9PEZI|nr:unnamed protein product [Parascedosporium putredinis]CAI7988058.1 unnamed protein product [Parascedosporium putredinis]